jgi:glycosyltransferase involved in cell wall biosynthesis
MAPLVSAVVTTYNQAPYIEDALRSATGQTYPHVEIIVVDDGSIDDTPARLARFGDRITVVRQPNLGVAASRNTGIRRARGELIAFLDGDDLWEPGKLAAQVDAALRHPGSGLIVTDGVQFTDRTVIGASLLSRTGRTFLGRSPDPVVTGRCYHELLAGNFICTTSQVMIPAHVLGAVGPSDTRFRVASDYDLYLRIAARYDVTVVRQLLTRWRYLPGSASGPQEVRRLRWEEDGLAILTAHLRNAPDADRRIIRNALRRRLGTVAQEAYYYGCEVDRSAATRYLLRLQLRYPSDPVAVPFLLGLWSPRRVTGLLGPVVRKLLRARLR